MFCQLILYFFWKFCFSLRSFYEELIWWINCSNFPLPIFCKHWSFIWGCYFLRKSWVGKACWFYLLKPAIETSFTKTIVLQKLFFVVVLQQLSGSNQFDCHFSILWNNLSTAPYAFSIVKTGKRTWWSRSGTGSTNR